jgi:hypothetical protein
VCEYSREGLKESQLLADHHVHRLLTIPQFQVEEYADEVFDALDNGAHIYFCGLKGMMPGIQVRAQLPYREKVKVQIQWSSFI